MDWSVLVQMHKKIELRNHNKRRWWELLFCMLRWESYHVRHKTFHFGPVTNQNEVVPVVSLNSWRMSTSADGHVTWTGIRDAICTSFLPLIITVSSMCGCCSSSIGWSDRSADVDEKHTGLIDRSRTSTHHSTLLQLTMCEIDFGIISSPLISVFFLLVCLFFCICL